MYLSQPCYSLPLHHLNLILTQIIQRIHRRINRFVNAFNLSGNHRKLFYSQGWFNTQRTFGLSLPRGVSLFAGDAPADNVFQLLARAV